jgi:hypothetical protein
MIDAAKKVQYYAWIRLMIMLNYRSSQQ